MILRAALIAAFLTGGVAHAQITTSSRGVVTPAPAAPPVREPVIAPPPAPASEIAQAFQSEVNAIVGTGAARRVLVSRTEPWGRVTRTLRVGDEYRDGWRIATLGTSQVTLSKDGTRQTIDISSRVAAVGGAAPAPAPSVETARPVVVAGSLGVISPPPPPVPAAEGEVAAQAGAVDMDLVNALLDQLSILTAAITPR